MWENCNLSISCHRKRPMEWREVYAVLAARMVMAVLAKDEA